jgi:hypothetical protein
MEPIYSDRPCSCCSYSHKIINTTVFGVGPPPRCCSLQNHASDTGGWALSDCCSYTQDNQNNFFIVSGHGCVYSHKNHGAEFYSDQPTSCCSHSQSYPIQLFWSIITSRCCVLTKIMHPTPAADGLPFRLFHKNNQVNFFHRIRYPQILRVLTKKSIGPD